MSGSSVVMTGAVNAVADKIMDNIDELLGEGDRMYQTKYNWRGEPMDGGRLQEYPNNYVFRVVLEDGMVCIGGEAATMALAEEDAYTKWQAYLSCTEHEFERGEFRNGIGVCKKCKCVKADVFEPLTLCMVCHMPTSYKEDNAGGFWCEHHVYSMPTELWTDKMWRKVYADYAMHELNAHMNNAYARTMIPKMTEPDGMLFGYPLVYLAHPTTDTPSDPDDYDASVDQVI